MAAIDDLIAQIEDKALRERLRTETDRITKEKKFGLVFEDHLPELTPVYSAMVKKNSKVALQDGKLSDLWRVLSVRNGEAHCRNIGSGEMRQFAVDDLVVVRQFGEPIFPALVPVDRVQNGPDDAPWHTLIEADNYHALQLLDYLHAGKVDCIYIDPPYNSGARDWKYNNDYVDDNDNWRHSKWLAFMRRRLKLAKRLLKPDDSVLIVTIDEKEYLHLGMLLEQMFPNARMQMVTIVINAPGQTRKQQLARVEEYAYFIFFGDAEPPLVTDDLLNDKPSHNPNTVRWESLLRSGTNSRRIDRPALFYPVFIRPESRELVDAGDAKPIGTPRSAWEVPNGTTAVWPLKSDGTEGNWRASPEYLRQLSTKGFVRVGEYRANEGRGTIWYLGRAAINKIDTGEILVVGRDAQGAVVVTPNPESIHGRRTVAKTVWNRSLHHAGWHGTNLLGAILPGKTFPFPKSLYSVVDALRLAVGHKTNAVVVDYFAGSGTTLNAVNILNLMDGGQRHCVMVTNNEVSEQDAINFKAKGYRQGQIEWERHGICQSITWPRSKYTVLGKRDDGSELEGEYFTGKTIDIEKPRKINQIAFTSIEELDSATKKKQLVALIDGIPQSEVKKDSAFVVSEKYPASILFDESLADAWLEALEGQEHITDFYIVTTSKSIFDDLKASINDLLGPVIVTGEEKRPMRAGFRANLEYFRLDFLDKDHVALGRQFREILPILWLRAGAIGPRPELPKNKPIPAMLIPEHNPFAVLVDESRFADFAAEVEGRNDLSHAYLVTDSEDAFQEMAGQLKVANVIQLYRDYLENFVINKGEGAA